MRASIHAHSPPLRALIVYFCLEENSTELKPEFIKGNYQIASKLDLYNCKKEYGRLFSLVARVPGYKSRGSRFDSRRYQIFMRSGDSRTGNTQPREDN
jgi:hypothetical protein